MSFSIPPPPPDALVFFIVFLLDTTYTIYLHVLSIMAESRVDRRLRFLRSGINANFTVVCKDREWRVDRGVLATESEYFQKLCIGDFSEASEGKVSFPEEEPEVIDQVLVYLYTGAYDDMAVIAKPEEATPGGEVTTAETSSQYDESFKQQGSQDTDNDPSTPGLSKAIYVLGLSETPWDCEHDYPEIARLSSASAESLTTVLKTGILVYRCAKMMSLAELQSLAFQRFMEKEQYFLRSNFADVLTTLYKNTESDDKPMRLEVTARCVLNKSVLKEYSDGSVPVLQEYEACAWGIGVRMLVAKNNLYKLYQKECDSHAETRDAHESTKSRLTLIEKYWANTQNDLADIDYEWDRLPWNCTKCGRDMSTSRWITQRGDHSRKLFMCRCSKKYEARQPL